MPSNYRLEFKVKDLWIFLIKINDNCGKAIISIINHYIFIKTGKIMQVWER